ncbi:MAG: vitamin K epoxide reductase family protein [Anaerolineales bacterium]|jgi:uncharacterized membrane protein
MVRKLAWGSVILGALGFLDAAYLAWIKLFGGTAVCAGIGDCETVNNSIYAEIGGVPIALLGAGAYLVVMLIAAMMLRSRNPSENLGLAFFGITLVGVLYSAYLTYIEVAVLHAVCPFCVTSAVIMILLWGISLLLLWRSPDENADMTGGA